MKKFLAQVLAVVLLASNLFICTVPASAEKAEVARSIAIVFDNSGSMYVKGEQAWCRATYAMEVFAAMLNAGDSLMIHPMNPIQVGGQEFTMNKPLVITDPSQSALIREIYTPKAGDTHIETIDAAINGLAATETPAKYLIVLTDGQVFYEGGKELSAADTKTKLSARFQKNIGPDLNILYLGIGSKVAMPEVDSEFYMGEKASDSKDVLSKLTMLCNKIFARDTLPKSHISGKTIDFDITLSKLIVFVQGENVSDLTVKGKGGTSATFVSSAKTQYSNIAAGNYKKPGQSPVDTSLQGMLVTYADCTAGEYDISYSGKASNVEVYYEPDADLNFLFTDEEGNLVDPESLYEGDYQVQFGLKDAKTGELITSDLIGDPTYEGAITINGQDYAIEHSGKSGVIPVTLNVGDTFEAELTASYLSGYSITKSAKDFGWPDSSLTVVARPVAAPKIALKASQTYFQISRLEKGKSIKAYITTKGKKYPAEEFAELTLKLDTEGLGYSVTPLPEESAFEIKLDKSGKVDPGKYKINAVVSRTDDLGKEWKSKDSCTVQLRSIPLWLLWLLILLILIILAIIIYVVAHIKHLPTKLHASTKPGHRDMNVGGVDETGATIFRAGITDSVLKVETNFAGSTNGVRMGIEPGTDAILAKKAVKKKIRVKASTVRAFGAANIEEVNVGNKQYIVNPETGKLESAIGDTNDFELSHNNTVTYSGTMLRNGVEEPFFATVKLDFKKK